MITVGATPSRVDLVSEITGAPFAGARPNTVRGHYGAVQVSFIGGDGLVRNKQSTSRTQDKVDAEELGRRGKVTSQ